MKNKDILSLKEYLSIYHLKKKGFAQQVGISVHLLKKYSEKEQIPPIDVALKIQKVTNGIVPITIWLKDKN